jgi:signal peptidase I
MEVQKTRKVRPVLAFFANFLGPGLGYLYVGEMRFALATVAGTYFIVAFFGWTRLIIRSAMMWWLVTAIVVLIMVISFIHSTVIAARNRDRPAKAYNRWWVYLLWFVVLVAGTVFLRPHRADFFGFEPFRAPTVAMSPTIEQGDFFMTDTWRYKSHEPADGEIVVFERPDLPGVKYVKRVVGVPGDRIELRDGVLYRNGQRVSEPYLHAPWVGRGYVRDYPMAILGPGVVFVLGDFRDNSLDSRAWGPIPINKLHGRVEYIWFAMAGGSARWDRVGISLRP